LNLAKAFKNQGRKVVLVGVDNQLVNHPNPNELEILLLNDQSFTKYTRQMMNDVINELKEDYDNIIILNEPLMQSSKSNLYMSLSDLNLVVLDSRLSSVKRIEETELIRDEYKIPNLHFLLNRFNYNPNVIVEFFNFFRNGFKKLNKTPDAIA
jgi:septum formation inhibitor-activating ATPase MinD